MLSLSVESTDLLCGTLVGFREADFNGLLTPYSRAGAMRINGAKPLKTQQNHCLSTRQPTLDSVAFNSRLRRVEHSRIAVLPGYLAEIAHEFLIFGIVVAKKRTSWRV